MGGFFLSPGEVQHTQGVSSLKSYSISSEPPECDEKCKAEDNSMMNEIKENKKKKTNIISRLSKHNLG